MNDEVTEKPPPTKWACDTCADRGEVAIILESVGGPRRKPLPCPDCGGSPLTFASARDAAIGKLNGEIEGQGRVLITVIIALGIMTGVVFLLLLSIRKLQAAGVPIVNLTDIGGEVK